MRLTDVFAYDEETGKIFWLVNRSNQVFAGAEAGYKTVRGYIYIEHENSVYRAERLAWFLFYGEWPNKTVDHKNRIKHDNRIINLRLATRSQNNANSSLYSNNKSGFRGVTWAASSKKWKASIRENGKMRYLGIFSSKEEASAAYVEAAKKLHGEFASEDTRCV